MAPNTVTQMNINKSFNHSVQLNWICSENLPRLFMFTHFYSRGCDEDFAGREDKYVRGKRRGRMKKGRWTLMKATAEEEGE